MVETRAEIQHPVVRAILNHYHVHEPLDISVMADLPARSGLGSSSAFTVGLINLVARLQETVITKLDLARQAVFVERELLAENVGVQDQYHATYGGINRFDFELGRTRLTPVSMNGPCLSALTESLFLLFTGTTRFASDTLNEQISKTKEGAVDRDLSHLLALTDQAVEVLEGGDPQRMLLDFGTMLHEGWEIKKRLSSKISSAQIDALYSAARAAGALGGKLCGAGSGGFLLVVVPPDKQVSFFSTLRNVVIIPVGLDTVGATILSA